MPGSDDPTRRLDALLDDLLGDHPLEADPILSRISHVLSSMTGVPAQARIARRLKLVKAFSAETAARAACAMHLGGVPAHRLVHFLSASLPGSLALSQFELLVRFVFKDDPPVSQQLVYDITQYTYLERKLLAQRSVDLATRLKDKLTPQVLLYLYLLSLRDDLSNENVHLILLILKICFPALKVRGRARELSLAEQREVAEAWKNAQKSVRYAGILPSTASRGPDAGAPRESASYFLDKYFSDREPPALREAPAERSTGHAPDRLTFTRSSARGGTPRAPHVGAGRRAPAEAGVPRARRSRPQARRRAAPKVAAPAASSAKSPAPEQRPRVARGRVLKVGLFILAGLLVALGIAVGLRQAVQAPGQPVQTGTQAPGAQAQAGTQPQPATPAHPGAQTRVVQRGDSLWKIYHSLRSDGSVQEEWQDFLRVMKQQNDLPDPDRIYPGNVLSITTQRP